MKLGHFALPPFVKGVEGAIDSAAALGFYSVELTASYFPDSMPREAMLDSARRIKAYADEKGVALRCFSWCVDISQNTEASVAILKKYADVCQVTDCKYLHHTLVCSFAPGSVNFEEKLPQIIPACREVYDYAATKGVQVVYEPQGAGFNGVQNLKKFVQALDRAPKFVADLGNTYFVNESPDRVIRAFGKDVVHVHVKDYRVIENLSEAPLPYIFGRTPERAATFYTKCCYPTPNKTYLADALPGEGVNYFVSLFTLLLV